ncbi:MAG TPA: hypothetical protein VGF79_15400, partial [Bacteroidia bacterium]
ETIGFYDSMNEYINLSNMELIHDSCYEYLEMEGMHFFTQVKYKGKGYEYTMTGKKIILYSAKCNKVINLFPDSFYKNDYLVWIDSDTLLGKITISYAPDSSHYPYHCTTLIKSIKFQWDSLCSKNDNKTDERVYQFYFEDKVKVQINLNQRNEINFKALCTHIFCENLKDVKILTFYNSKGEVLLQKNIEFNTSYKFLLDKFANGSTLYYTITSLDYKLSGKLKRSK